MSRNICICADFLTDSHKEKIKNEAKELGFVPYFFLTSQLDEAKKCLQSCEIFYGYTPELLRAAPVGLKWFCCCMAGADTFCKDPSIFANPDCVMTNSNVFGVTIAEHVVMVTLMLLRRMPEHENELKNHTWSHMLNIRSIRDNEVTILGTGNIGSNVADRMRGMGAGEIIGLSRSGRANPSFDRVYPISELNKILPRTKILVMALPDTKETVRILDRERLGLLPQDAYVINVGRGSAIDQNALMDALNDEQIAGAALDVMVPEPLPQDHPLWNAKNIIITPHISGNMSLGYTCDANVDSFCRDLRNYAAGRPLESVVDRERGY